MSVPLGIVAGSGINLLPLLDRIHEEIPFHNLPGLHDGHVEGHRCAFLRGICAGQPLIIQSGRLHAYEGLSYEDVVRPVDALHAFGVQRIIFTNAVGGIAPQLRPGDFVGTETVHTWPYPRFSLPPHITPGFALDGCTATGPYLWMHGPCYETQAEVRVLRKQGMFTVGMSGAPELHRCHELGLQGALISCVTNLCNPAQRLTHEHVLRTASQASEGLSAVLRRFVGGEIKRT